MSVGGDRVTDIVAAFADRMERRDWPAFAALLAADVIYEIPQTGERIRGRDRYVTFNAEFPGDWHVTPEIILGDDHHGCMLFRWTSDAPGQTAETAPGVAFFEIDAGLIAAITDYWPEPYEPPSGREHLVERY